MITLFKKSPLKHLVFGKFRINGRNNKGIITVYHRGGGNKRLYRKIDFSRYIWNVYGVILRFEYDPNRTSLIALVAYANGVFSYILAVEGLSVGDTVCAKSTTKLHKGWASYLYNFKPGSFVNCVEHLKGQGMIYARTAGAYARVVSHTKGNTILKLRSKILIRVRSGCMATLGTLVRARPVFYSYRKASFFILKGWRPVVRGVAMNPIDHPHGGGEGKTSGGRPSVTPWGKITKGLKTRKQKSYGTRILKR